MRVVQEPPCGSEYAAPNCLFKECEGRDARGLANPAVGGVPDPPAEGILGRELQLNAVVALRVRRGDPRDNGLHTSRIIEPVPNQRFQAVVVPVPLAEAVEALPALFRIVRAATVLLCFGRLRAATVLLCFGRLRAATVLLCFGRCSAQYLPAIVLRRPLG